MDGYNIKKIGFICREMGIINCESNTTFSYFFRTPPFNQLLKEDWPTMRFCENQISIFSNISREAAKNNQLVAFKGGHIEKDIFTRLNVKNYIDIGCKKYESLLVEYGDELLKSCNNHIPLKNNKMPHYPESEVRYFNRWCNKHLW